MLVLNDLNVKYATLATLKCYEKALHNKKADACIASAKNFVKQVKQPGH